MTTFTLEPQENDRLQSLCGAFDENIKLIEKEFNLNISRNNFTYPENCHIGAVRNHLDGGRIVGLDLLARQAIVDLDHLVAILY